MQLFLSMFFRLFFSKIQQKEDTITIPHEIVEKYCIKRNKPYTSVARILKLDASGGFRENGHNAGGL